MDERDDRLRQQAANARLIHLNEQIIFPYLARAIDNTLAQLCSKYKADSKVDEAKVAYICACRDLLTDLEAAARHGDRAFARLQDNRQPTEG